MKQVVYSGSSIRFLVHCDLMFVSKLHLTESMPIISNNFEVRKPLSKHENPEIEYQHQSSSASLLIQSKKRKHQQFSFPAWIPSFFFNTATPSE